MKTFLLSVVTCLVFSIEPSRAQVPMLNGRPWFSGGYISGTVTLLSGTNFSGQFIVGTGSQTVPSIGTAGTGWSFGPSGFGANQIVSVHSGSVGWDFTASLFHAGGAATLASDSTLSFKTAAGQANTHIVLPSASVNTLLGGLATDGTGVLQFPAGAADNTSGLGFGADTYLFRPASATLTAGSATAVTFKVRTLTGGRNIEFNVSDAGNTASILDTGFSTSNTFTIGNTSTGRSLVLVTGAQATALTLDSSQNATFAGAVTFPGSANKQRFYNNFSTSGQAPTAATRTYITGSQIAITAGQIIVGTVFRWSFTMTKTAAGTAASTIDVAFGTNGTTGDTARVSFTKPAGTAAVDEGWVQVECVVKTNSASGVVVGECSVLHNGNTAGHMTIPLAVLQNTSGTFDTTTPTKIGLCITTGAADAITINQVVAQAINL